MQRRSREPPAILEQTARVAIDVVGSIRDPFSADFYSSPYRKIIQEDIQGVLTPEQDEKFWSLFEESG